MNRPGEKMTSLKKAKAQEVDRKRKEKGWTQRDPQWQEEADVSEKSLQRFWDQDNLKEKTFISICKAVGIDNWQDYAEEDFEPPSWNIADESREKGKLLRYPNGYVRAIRILGNDDQYFTESKVHIDYKHEFYEIPSSDQILYDAHIRRKEEESRVKGKENVFFNGPAARLLDWRTEVPNDDCVALEQQHLFLTLAPLGWYDYEAMNGRLRDSLTLNPPFDVIDNYLGIEKLLAPKTDISGCKLTTIIGTATTLVSMDGYILYQIRSNSNSARPNMYTSSVAENINRFKDDVKDQNSRALINPPSTWQGVRPGNDYRPQGTLHLFATVRRGIGEEICQYLSSEAIKLTGLA